MNEMNDSTTSLGRGVRSGCETGEVLTTDAAQPRDISEEVPQASKKQKVAMTVAVVGPFLGVVVAAAICWQYGFMGWHYLAMLVVGWILTTFGITVGFHRLLAHKSFETYRWVKATLMMLGALSVEGAPLIWCAVHRRHHGHSDQEGDPHSPNLSGGGWRGMIKGLWHGQIGWLFSGYWSKPNFEKYIPDLTKDKLLTFIDRHYYLFVLASIAIPAAIGYGIEAYLGVRNPWYGAWLGFLWGGLVRIFMTHHITWSINSVCHVFGKRHFRSGDHSTNNLICALLSMGEGWHNNHHAFPSSARHGLFWYQLDMSWLLIRCMQAVGLAWDVKLPSRRALEARRIR